MLISRRHEFGGLRGLGIEWGGEKLLCHRQGVVVVDAQLHRLIVFGDGAVALALGIVGVAFLDMRPDLDPRRLQGAVKRRIKIVEGRLPVALLEIEQTKIVVDPRIRTVQLQRRFKLLLRFSVEAFLHLLDAAARDYRDAQVVRHAQDSVVWIDDNFQRLAV